MDALDELQRLDSVDELELRGPGRVSPLLDSGAGCAIVLSPPNHLLCYPTPPPAAPLTAICRGYFVGYNTSGGKNFAFATVKASVRSRRPRRR